MFHAPPVNPPRRPATVHTGARGLVLLGLPLGPAGAVPQPAALPRLVGLGIDGIWLSQQAFVQGLRPMPSLLDEREPLNTVGLASVQDPELAWVRHAQACGLAVFSDTQPSNGRDPGHSTACLRLQPCNQLWQGEPLAPALHAALACCFKLPAPQALCWMLDESTGQDGSAPAASRRAQVLLALQLCLKGCHLMNGTLAAAASSWLAQFLAWRRQQPALTQGRQRLLSMHGNLLLLERSSSSQKMLCAFNPSERYVRHRLPPAWAGARLLPGSGLDGARLVQQHVDCDPWGVLFATQPQTQPKP